jgi:ferredoxin
MPYIKNNIKIDSRRCTRCNSCIDVCPGDILEMGNESVLVAHPERCVSCGHCAAICPVEAISCEKENTRAPFTIDDIPNDLPPDQALFLKKRSTRKFKSDIPDKEILKSMILYAEKAPSSHNFRRRQYIMVTDADKIREMEEIVVKVYRSLLSIMKPWVIKLIKLFSKQMGQELEELSHDFRLMVEKHTRGGQHAFRGAPCVCLIAAPGGYDQSRDDCVAAQHYMMLYAETRGISSCIIGFAQYAHKKLEKYLNITSGNRIYTVSIFGYARHKYTKTVNHRYPSVTWL